jgi:branched-chain amino acid transport system substrate-binding protein
MRFSRYLTLLGSALTLAGTVAAGAERIGVVTSLESGTALLGQQLLSGATLAARDGGVEIVTADDQCSAEGGEKAALDLVTAEVDAVVGFLCTEAIEAALPIFTQAGIPVITPGVRSNGITDRRQREQWLVWRTGPRTDAELAAVGDILVRRWREEHFALVDDGTIHGRELVESFRLAAEMAGLKPLLVDTFRPQSENQIALIGRLRRAGVTHLFVGGDRDDIAIMSRDAQGLDYRLTIAGPETLRATGDIPVATGTLMIGIPEWADRADETALARFRQEGIAPEGYVAPGHAAMEVAIQALSKAESAGSDLGAVLSSGSFQTILGTIAFDDKGDATGNPYRLLRFDGQRFLAVE